MDKVNIIYKGKDKEVENVNTYLELADKLTKGNHQFVVCEVNGQLKDLNSTIIKNNFEINFYDFNSDAGKEVYWHSSSHILAQAVKNLYPESKFTIGPAIKNGFYYDFDMNEYHFHPEDIQKIEDEAKKIINMKLDITRKELSKPEALKLFKDNPYKIELIENLPDEETISVYGQGDFYDLCRGPHIHNTGLVKSFKVMSFAGAYWRGDSKNKMLQRIYAISFSEEKLLKKYLNYLEEAKKRDHRKIGKELDLFSFHEEGPGFPFWHSNGSIVFQELIEFMRVENRKRGYSEIMTPPILNDILWKKSGHWDNYKENMYFTDIDERSFAVKPMNCPGGLLVYNTKLHSYRELPIKQAEFGLVHRHELSGVLHGLFRVRSFTQDDAHIFCNEEQLKEQIKETVTYILEVYKTFGFKDFDLFIATRPDHSIGTDENWSLATLALEESLKELELDYKLKEGEGAFYGPKIEFNIKDSLERNWQCGTIQVDFSMPERFDMTYEGTDGKPHRPIMIHRAILGSLERFIGILIEHFSGKLPLWIAPIQVRIINVAEVHIEYAQKIVEKLKQNHIRVDQDFRNETLGYKIREARNRRIPYTIVIGDKESENDILNVRNRKNKTKEYKTDEFIGFLNDEIQSKSID